MSANMVPLVAEWALYGKKPVDTGASILECSQGVLSQENFAYVLNRYSPGTLDYLPQVTISWLSDKQERNYVAIAIHDVSEDKRYDARGREIVFTRLFCVPYDDAATGAVCYRAMYEGFRPHLLQGNNRAPIRTVLTAPPPSAPPTDDPALGVAALLLTGTPVCILGADDVALDERLRFLDTVMSLLPYGMRSRLSASTWASSTHRHKFRLFFASKRREASGDEGPDHVVYWGQPGPAPVGSSFADQYLLWLRDQLERPMLPLAVATQQIGFGQTDVLKTLNLLGVPNGTSGTDLLLYAPGFQDPDHGRGAELASDDVGNLIAYCVDHLTDVNTLSQYLTKLRGQLDKPRTDDERQLCRFLIKQHRLLRADLPLDSQMQQDFYTVLLRLAFDLPLTYPDYCEIEACVGYPEGHPLHPALLRVLLALGLERRDLGLYVLVVESLGSAEMRRFLDANHVTLDALLGAVADVKLRPAHGRKVCAVTLWELSERYGRFNRGTLRTLRKHGYLAPALQRRHPGEPDYQVLVLGKLLRAAYPGKLGGPQINEILGNIDFEPTKALLVAVLQMAHGDDANMAKQLFIRSFLRHTNSASANPPLMLPPAGHDQQREPASRPEQESLPATVPTEQSFFKRHVLNYRKGP